MIVNRLLVIALFLVTSILDAQITFRATPGMAVPRDRPTSLTLPDGRVLVTGSDNSIEFFDPQGEAFGERFQTLSKHTGQPFLMSATRVALIGAGAAQPTGALPQGLAEVCDLATRTCAETKGPMNFPRYGHRVIALSTTSALIVGGVSVRESNPFGGAVLDSEIFDARTETFLRAGRLAVARFQRPWSALLPDGSVLVGSADSTTTEVFNPATRAFEPGPSSQAAYGDQPIVLQSGKLLFLTGTSSEIFDPSTRSWTRIPGPAVPRSSYSANLIGGRVLLVGGQTGAATSDLQVDQFDEATRTFSAVGTLDTPRFSHGSAVLPSHRLLIFGGSGDASASISDSVAGEVSRRSVIPIVGAGPGANGSFFRTAIYATNPMNANATFRLKFSGATGQKEKTYSIAPHATVSVGDIVSELNASGFGTLDIFTEPAATAPLLIAHVFSEGATGGTAGFLMSDVKLENALRAGDTATLVLPRDSVKLRMNVGARALTSAVIDFQLRDSSGEVRATATRAVAADSVSQESVGALFTVPNIENGSITLLLRSGTAVAYGSFVDNVTNDPSFQLAVRDQN